MLAPLKGREFENKLPSDSYIPLHIGSHLNSKPSSILSEHQSGQTSSQRQRISYISRFYSYSKSCVMSVSLHNKLLGNNIKQEALVATMSTGNDNGIKLIKNWRLNQENKCVARVAQTLDKFRPSSAKQQSEITTLIFLLLRF